MTVLLTCRRLPHVGCKLQFWCCFTYCLS